MIRTNKQWEMWCYEHGTSGDQVFQILEDWRWSEGIANQECEWRRVEGTFYMETDCGNLFFTNHYEPREAGFNFCPFCGNEIIVERIGDE